MSVDVNAVALGEMGTKYANLSIEMAQAVGMNQSLIEQLNQALEELKVLRAELGLNPETGEQLEDEEGSIEEDPTGEVEVDVEEEPAPKKPTTKKAAPRKKVVDNGES